MRVEQALAGSISGGMGAKASIWVGLNLNPGVAEMQIPVPRTCVAIVNHEVGVDGDFGRQSRLLGIKLAIPGRFKKMC